MKDTIIASDFDGTITQKDTLYAFLLDHAPKNEVNRIGQEWIDGKINSQQCIIQEFNLIPNLSKKMINDFISTLKIDEGFLNFNKKRIEKGIDFIIVSDGLDYFIDRILQKFNLTDIKVITNHAYFENEKFIIKFPNTSCQCKVQAGTCKCNIIKELKKEYKTVYYCGDGASDFCVANKADKVFAKSRLLDYCELKNIPYQEFSTFEDISRSIFG